ncbi:MAG: hypothetical protein MUC88_28360, partial [Planctomycetes bacterium]|nr:hypothetical protein [Planctomycetota bacterium]
DAMGRVQMEVLPGQHRYGLTYQAATQYVYSSAVTVVFQTRLVTVELRDSAGNLIPGSGAVILVRSSGSNTFVVFAAGQLGAAGRAQMEVLPVPHQFYVTYLGITRQQSRDDPWVVFWASDFR